MMNTNVSMLNEYSQSKQMLPSDKIDSDAKIDSDDSATFLQFTSEEDIDKFIKFLSAFTADTPRQPSGEPSYPLGIPYNQGTGKVKLFNDAYEN